MTEACELTSPSRGNEMSSRQVKEHLTNKFVGTLSAPPPALPLHVGPQNGTDTLAIDNTGRESEAKERKLREVFQFCYV